MEESSETRRERLRALREQASSTVTKSDEEEEAKEEEKGAHLPSADGLLLEPLSSPLQPTNRVGFYTDPLAAFTVTAQKVKKKPSEGPTTANSYPYSYPNPKSSPSQQNRLCPNPASNPQACFGWQVHTNPKLNSEPSTSCYPSPMSNLHPSLSPRSNFNPSPRPNPHPHRHPHFNRSPSPSPSPAPDPNPHFYDSPRFNPNQYPNPSFYGQGSKYDQGVRRQTITVTPGGPNTNWTQPLGNVNAYEWVSQDSSRYQAQQSTVANRGYGGTRFQGNLNPNMGRGRGRGGRNRGSNGEHGPLYGRGRGRGGGGGGVGAVSAITHPQLFAKSSMLEDPWKGLVPVRIDLPSGPGSCSDPPVDWLSNSILLNNKKLKCSPIEGKPPPAVLATTIGGVPSLADSLAASFSEAVYGDE